MASSSLTVFISEEQLRKYGGTRKSVKSLFKLYNEMTLEQFLTKHPFLNESDFHRLQLRTRFNKS